MMPLYYVLGKCTGRGIKLSKLPEKISHLMCKENIVVLAKKEKSSGDPDTNKKNIQSGYRNLI